MKLLFDTHAFIWWDSDQSKLSETALSLCEDPRNSLLLSVVCVWEIQIKAQLGKLSLERPLGELIAAQRERNAIELLPISLDHALGLDDLPLHHRDPFDRLLMSQARIEEAVLLTCDSKILRYDVPTRW